MEEAIRPPDSDLGEGIDYSMVALVGVGVIVIVVGIIALLYSIHMNELEPFIERCNADPRLLYAKNCKVRDDCLDACVDRLRSVGS